MEFPDPGPKSGPWFSPPFPPSHHSANPSSEQAELFLIPAFPQLRPQLRTDTQTHTQASTPLTSLHHKGQSLHVVLRPPAILSLHPCVCRSSEARGRNLQGSNIAASGPAPERQATNRWSWSMITLQTPELPIIPFLWTRTHARPRTWGSYLL